jgi:hypothetical protein
MSLRRASKPNFPESVEKTATHFHWSRVLVTRALAYAKAFPEEIRKSREGETDTVPVAG